MLILVIPFQFWQIVILIIQEMNKLIFKGNKIMSSIFFVLKINFDKIDLNIKELV